MSSNQDHLDEGGGGASRTTDPASGSSSATDVSLREYLMAQIIASRDECRAGLRHLEETVQQSEIAAKEAVDKALVSIDKRFDGVNEFRGALNDLSKQMATKDQLDSLGDKIVLSEDALEQKFDNLYERNRDDISSLAARFNLREGSDSGARLTKGSLYTGVAVVIAAVGLLIVIATYFRPH